MIVMVHDIDEVGDYNGWEVILGGQLHQHGVLLFFSFICHVFLVYLHQFKAFRILELAYMYFLYLGWKYSKI